MAGRAQRGEARRLSETPAPPRTSIGDPRSLARPEAVRRCRIRSAPQVVSPMPAAAKTEPKELPFTCGASDIQWRDECQDEVGKSVNRPAKTDPDPGKKAEEAKEVPAYCKSRPNDAQYRDECRAAVVD